MTRYAIPSAQYSHSGRCRRFGKGESACMAYCKFNHNVIGGSNLRDILNYYKENDIKYLTTLGFLAEAYCKKMLT